MIDTHTLRNEIAHAISRFVDASTQAWIDARKRHFIDLSADPRPWNAPVRAANTNGSVLLDRYAYLLTSAAIEELGMEFTVTLITIGVMTDRSALFATQKECTDRPEK